MDKVNFVEDSIKKIWLSDVFRGYKKEKNG